MQETLPGSEGQPSGPIPGSSALLVLTECCGSINDSVLQEVEPSTAVHLPLDQLEADDLTFNRSIAPGLGDRRRYGIHVLPHTGGETAQACCGRRVHPGLQGRQVILAKQIGEGPHVPGRGPNFGRRLAQPSDEGALVVGERGRAAREQTCGPAR